MNTLLQDMKYAARMMVKKPGFTIVAVITLALGIGATTAIFSIVNAVLINPLPFHEPDRLAQFWETNPLKNWSEAPIAPANMFDWQAQNQSFTDIAAYMGSDKRGPGLTGLQLNTGDQPERLEGLYVTGNIFSVLGAHAMLGRTFFEEETEAEKSLVVVLSHGLWQRRFGGDQNIIGQKIMLNGRDREVVGVMPPDFYFPSREAEIWLPMGWNRDRMSALRRPHFLRAVGRLKPGVTIEQAQADMTLIAMELEKQYPDINEQMGVGVGPLKDWIVSDVQFPLVVLLAAVGFVLAVACANVANLLLARAASRSREVAIRSALGAKRTRIIYQLLTESLLLALLGGAAGLLLALWGKDLLIALNPGNIPRLDEIQLDWRVLSFTTCATLLTTLLTGLAPALQSSNPHLASTLKEGGQKGAASQSSRMRNALVIAEVALAIVLTVGAGLMIRSFLKLQEVNTGFDPNNILTFNISLPGTIYPQNVNVQTFYTQAEQRIRNLPGVEAVGATTRLPLTGYRWTSDMTIEGRPPEDYVREIRHKEITPDYFRAVGLPLINGRFFNESDNDKSPATVIVNATFARRYFPGEDAIGKRVKFGKPEDDDEMETIIGIVGDEKQEGLSGEIKPEVYKSYLQTPEEQMSIVVRTSTDPMSIVGAVREEIREIDRSLPIYEIKTMNEVVYESLARERFITTLFVIFALLALALASVGIYGVMAYSVAQRTQEMGIRMALGAQSRDVLKLVVWNGMKLTIGGVALGLFASFALTRLMASLLFGVTATDPLTFVIVAMILAIVALIACFVPAWRATRVDPMIALRYE